MSTPTPAASHQAPRAGHASRVALVTGAGSGIGRACAHALLADGWQVVFSGRRTAALQEAIAASSHPQAALALGADVADEASVARLFNEVQARYGRLDLLFNNAGIFNAGSPLEDLPVQAWRDAVDINLTGAFLCTQQAFRMMKVQSPRGGRIINNGSIWPMRRGRMPWVTPPPSMR